MWSQPPQWLQASHYENVPHNQVDWASLAKQWISMQQQPTHPMMPPVLPPPPAYSTDAVSVEPLGETLLNQDTWSQSNPSNSSDGYFKRVGQPPPPPPPPLPPTNSSVWVSPPPEFLPSTRQIVDYSHGGSSSSTRPSSVVLDYAHGDGASTTVPERRVVDYGHGFNQSATSTSTPPAAAPASAPAASSAASTDSSIAIDAMKRKNLPAWIRDGLEKMEREKQKKKEEEARKKKLEASKKPLWAQEDEEEAAEDDLAPPAKRSHRKREDESDEELPDAEPDHANGEPTASADNGDLERRPRKVSPQLILLSPEEKELQFALNVKRLMTEILMSVLQSETAEVAQAEIRRARNRVSTKPRKVTTALASIVGLAGYSDSDGSESDDQHRGPRGQKDDENDDSDLEERIKIRRKEFRKWEESAMKALDEKEREQQRRLNGDEREESPSPVNHGGRTTQRSPSPKASAPKPRDDRSASRSPKMTRKDPSEKSQDRLLSKDDAQKSPPRSRTRDKDHHKRERTRRRSSVSSSSESSRSSSKRKRSSKKDRRRSATYESLDRVFMLMVALSVVSIRAVEVFAEIFLQTKSSWPRLMFHGERPDRPETESKESRLFERNKFPSGRGIGSKLKRGETRRRGVEVGVAALIIGEAGRVVEIVAKGREVETVAETGQGLTTGGTRGIDLETENPRETGPETAGVRGTFLVTEDAELTDVTIAENERGVKLYRDRLKARCQGKSHVLHSELRMQQALTPSYIHSSSNSELVQLIFRWFIVLFNSVHNVRARVSLGTVTLEICFSTK